MQKQEPVPPTAVPETAATYERTKQNNDVTPGDQKHSAVATSADARGPLPTGGAIKGDMNTEVPDGWDQGLPTFDPNDDAIATRKASSEVIQWAAKQVPTLVSGSADLEPSTLTEIDDGGSVAPGDYAGRNVHYGVREHGMGAMVNGLVLHGFRAFGSTFFNFLDYMKASVRIASARSKRWWKSTHQSPFLPTPSRAAAQSS